MIPLLHLLQREVPHERITFMEELGRGALCKVHRGALKELPTVEIFDKPRDQRVAIKEAKVVAIKTLLGEQKNIYGTELTWVPYWPILLLIIKITISSIVIGLKISYFPLIHLPSSYCTVCYWTVQ